MKKWITLALAAALALSLTACAGDMNERGESVSLQLRDDVLALWVERGNGKTDCHIYIDLGENDGGNISIFLNHQYVGQYQEKGAGFLDVDRLFRQMEQFSGKPRYEWAGLKRGEQYAPSAK